MGFFNWKRDGLLLLNLLLPQHMPHPQPETFWFGVEEQFTAQFVLEHPKQKKYSNK